MCFRCFPALAGEVFSNVAFRPIAREQKYLMDYKKKLWDEVEHDMQESFFFRPIAREQKYLMDYKKKLWDEVEHDM